jgi:preprotein translocase subunit SecD
MPTRRSALGGLALLLAGTGLARDGSHGWRMELRTGRASDDVGLVMRALAAKAADIGGPQPEIAPHGRRGVSLTWRAAVEPDDAEAVFDLLPRFAVHEVVEVPEMVSLSMRLPGDRPTEPSVQPGRRILEGRDLAIATAATDRLGLPSVRLAWTAAGHARARRATRRLLGRRLMFLVGGRAVSAPLVVEPFRRRSEIGGRFTPETAVEAARAFTEAAVLGRVRRVASGPLRPKG